MKHDELLDNLAIAKETIFKNVNLGSPHHAWDANIGGVPKADILKVFPSYHRFLIDIFEVKSTRRDFLSDIRTEKWKKYLPFCHRFYFAILDGIAEKHEIPEDAGLYVYDKKGWICRKLTTKREIELDMQMLLSIIFYRQKKQNSNRYFLSHWKELELKKLGKQINKALWFYHLNKDNPNLKNGGLYKSIGGNNA